MDAIKIFARFAIVAAMVCGCSPRITPPAEIRDSVRVEIRERVIHDTIGYEIPKAIEIQVVKDTISYLSNDYAESKAEVDSMGYLHHSLASRPQVLRVPYTVVVRDTTVVHKEAETIVKEVERQLTKWQSFSMVLGWILGGLLLLGVILWCIKKFLFKV